MVQACLAVTGFRKFTLTGQNCKPDTYTVHAVCEKQLKDVLDKHSLVFRNELGHMKNTQAC